MFLNVVNISSVFDSHDMFTTGEFKNPEARNRTVKIQEVTPALTRSANLPAHIFTTNFHSKCVKVEGLVGAGSFICVAKIKIGDERARMHLCLVLFESQGYEDLEEEQLQLCFNRRS